MNRWALGCALLVLLTVVTRLEAETLTYTQPIDFPDTSSPGKLGMTSIKQYVDLTFPQFDSAYGTLVNVGINFEAYLTSPATVIWDNEADSLYAKYYLITYYVVFAPDHTPWGGNYRWSWTTTIQADNDAAPDFAGTDSITITTWTDGRFHRGDDLIPDSLAAYTGGEVALVV